MVQAVQCAGGEVNRLESVSYARASTMRLVACLFLFCRDWGMKKGGDRVAILLIHIIEGEIFNG
jgi:hypothetical protein